MLSEREQLVCAEIERRRSELVALAADLIAFDTTARSVGDPPRQEAALQEYLAARLLAVGAGIDLWEPDAEQLRGKPLVPPGLDFAGRPQLVARVPGTGTGRSLLLNGHIDVVSAEPVEQWTTPPFRAEVRDGRLYGRGACDMKGGIAAMVFATEVLAALGVKLGGELLVATNTDEESSGAGGTAIVERGIRADAGIVTEPTGFDTWVSCRGSEYVVIRVPGRPGHAEVHQPAWEDGGAVNAIEKATLVIDAIRSLREEWGGRAELGHPRLSRPSLLPTMASAGEWPVTYPAVVRADGGRHVSAGPGRRARLRRRRPPGSRGMDRARDRPRRLAGRASTGVRVGAERRDAARDLRNRADRRRRATGAAPTSAGRARSAASTPGTTAPRSRTSRGFLRSASGRPASLPAGSASPT